MQLASIVRQNRYLRIVLILLLIVTWVFGVSDIRHQATDQLVTWDKFPGAPDKWQIGGNRDAASIDDSSVSLSTPDGIESYVFRSFDLPPVNQRQNKNIRLTGVIETIRRPDLVKQGREAGLMVWFLDSDSKGFSYTTAQGLLTHGKTLYADRTMPIPDKAYSFAIAMISRDSNGHFQLTQAHAELVSTTTLFKLVRLLIYLLWSVVFIVLLKRLLEKSNMGISVFLGGLFVATLVTFVLPTSFVYQFAMPTINRVLLIFTGEVAGAPNALFNLGHFLFFFSVAALLFGFKNKLALTRLVVFEILLLLILSTEGLQLYSLDRTASADDMLFNIAGVFVAWLVVDQLLNRLTQRKLSR